MRLPAWLFRVARPASPVINVSKTAAQIVIVWGFGLVALPAVIAAGERAAGVWRWRWSGRGPAGIAVLVVASTVGLIAAWVMATRGSGTPLPVDAARQLVIAGPYRVVRNPMAMSAIAQVIGVALILGSVGTLAEAAVGAVVWNRVIRPPEEAFLVDRFGADYERYRAAVNCWRLRWPPYRG